MGACHGPHQAPGARPGGGVLLAVHLPDVLLVIEYLLVPSPGPVLHIGQGPDPACNFKLQLLVVNLKIVRYVKTLSYPVIST